MSLATSMKSLVEDIHASIKERQTFVKNTVKDVKNLLGGFKEAGEVREKDLKIMATEVKKFLDQSEKARKGDFEQVMEDVSTRLDDIRKWQNGVRRDARELVKEYADDQKKARDYWLSLRK